MRETSPTTAMRKCMICGNHAVPAFEKNFEGRFGLGLVQYCACTSCGFVYSETHFSMNDDEWVRLNHRYHTGFFGTERSPDDPRWMKRLAAQQAAIGLLARKGVFDSNLPGCDYGCGDGKLADLLKELDVNVFKYEKFLTNADSDYLRDDDIRPGKFGLVINTSVMEHVRDLSALDEIANLVHPGHGVFAVHTLVCEKIPRDPSWFYLLPVHIAFYSNQSMEILVERWRFAASIYDVEARMWFLFRNFDAARRAYEAVRTERPEVHLKHGFVDYWK